MCHIVDPAWVKDCPFRTILVSWRAGLGQCRHIVGEITLDEERGALFSYRAGVSEIKKEGFMGFHGLPLENPIDQKTAFDLFLRRIINTEREDAEHKLAFWGIKPELMPNKLYLLGATQGRSANDEFEFLPVLQQMSIPYTFVTDIAGISYSQIDLKQLSVGERVICEAEPDNQYDEMAVCVMTQERRKIGYLKRGINCLFSQLAPLKVDIVHIIDTENIKQVFISCQIPAASR
ncbi:HIRAN domain-containing protein [Porphyromonas circumdentaria]|uniref:HIRAN domain-containing protein n=1 Tax=Porphyromonas circumdentaria TaxID=29524 RepID=A0A1T4LX27_9PORP|nr:HIRAN domain-containing protein [Porphyromonas circumdentaria]MBB6275401.1 hypothetical protein [Porphyromonas circumdentaria]MDO4722098.1 HIRAN domain-containing protein [Porphyromonas circumdentaria]SJZ59004.1 HIRAN domain-containing protein [Porphyromonas circumdentaria]